MVSQAHQEPG